MKQFNFATLDGVTVTVDVNPAGFIRVTSQGRSRSIALPRFARALHANPSAVSAEPLEGAVRLVLADGSAWIIFADTLHIAEEPRSVTEEFEAQKRELAAAAAPTATPTATPAPHSDNDSNNSQAPVKPERPVKTGSRKAAFLEALAAVLANKGLTQEDIQEVIANLSVASRRNGQRERIDPSTPEGKILAAARSLFFYLKRHSVTHYESKGSNFSILFDGTRVTFQFDDGSTITYPQ